MSLLKKIATVVAVAGGTAYCYKNRDKVAGYVSKGASYVSENAAKLAEKAKKYAEEHANVNNSNND
jgi:hypothetical protein